KMESIEKIAAKHNLAVIYDGAQAYGSLYKGKSAFQYGDISALSLHAYKIVSSIEGGALFTENDALHTRLFQMRYFGKDETNFEVRLGTNAKMSEFNAAYGLLSMQNAENEIAARKTIAKYYREN